MPLPVVLAVEEHPDALKVVEAQLAQRYAHDYRVMCLGNPGVALQKLTELAHAEEHVALVLAGMPQPPDVRSRLLEQVRDLHPHAKRALLVPLDVWADKPAADAVRTSIAFGGADYYVVRPAASPDEVFHEAVSGFLLEWATERRIVPRTIHIVGEAWRLVARSVDGLMDRSLPDSDLAEVEQVLGSFRSEDLRFDHVRTRRAGTRPWNAERLQGRRLR